MAVVTNDPGILINGTYFDNFEALMQALALLGVDTYAIQEAGINTLELFKEALAAKKIVPITTVREVIVGFAEVKGVDPANTTDVSTRVMTDVATGTGGSVVSYTMSGNRTLGLVTKAVAVGAVLSLLVAEIGAFLVPDEVQEDLITSADPYTIDHENIPVLIDENGKTHFEADFIEAIRARCIELGVFNTGAEEITIPSTLRPTYSWETPLPLYDIDDFNTIEFDVRQKASPDSNDTNHFKFIFDNITHTSPVYVAIIARRSSETAWKANVVLVSSESFSGTFDYYNYRNSGTVSHNATRSINVNYTNSHGERFYYHDMGDQLAINEIGPTWTSVSEMINTCSPNIDICVTNSIVSNSSSKNVIVEYAWLTKYGTISGGQAVEGLTPASDLINAGIADTTKSIAEVIPALGNGEKTSSPTVSDLLNKGVWYPISILKENVFTEGATDTDTSSAPNGDVSPEMEPDILDKIKELIEEALRDPDNPDAPVQPTIPVGDSGDSPPADPSLISGTGNGLWGIYNPNLSDVQAFGSWLWSSNIVDQIMRMFNSPIEAVIGFHMIYCTPIEGSVENIKCGFLDSGVSSPTVANQYVTIDCGTIDIPEYYHTALDYVATKLMLYLPFIGMIPLSTEICMGSRIQVIYRIDVLTGTCLAQVKVIKDNSEATMYAFPGNCAVQIPLTATTYTGMVGVLISGSSAVGSLLSGNLMSAVRHGANALASGINNLSGTQQSGSLGSNSGALGPRKPYLIITHPVAYDAMEYNTQYGYPINKTVSLGSLTGYTKVKDIHLSGIPCTDNELELIEQLLKEGVIIN